MDKGQSPEEHEYSLYKEIDNVPGKLKTPGTTLFHKRRLLPALSVREAGAGNASSADAPVVVEVCAQTVAPVDQDAEADAPQSGTYHAPEALTRPIPPRHGRHARLIRKKHIRALHVQVHRRRVRCVGLSLLCASLVVLFSSSVAISVNYYQSVLPHLQGLLNRQLAQSTRIEDRNGKLLYTLFDPNIGRSTPIDYTYIPGVLQDAQVATEDKTFWTNAGVDVSATVRSAILDLVAQQVATGASTLTQQVIKNLSGSAAVTGQRKLDEAALAIGLTQSYPKWKILEMYFNVASYGAQDLGVEAAVQDYFGLQPQCSRLSCIPATALLDRDLAHCTRPEDQTTCRVDPLLALARASLLAGIPQNPVHFDPTLTATNVTALLGRQKYVLDQMVRLHMSLNLGLGSQTQDMGAITPQMEVQVEALSQGMQFTGFQNILKAPHFVWWVIQQLANSLGNYQDINPNSGLSVPGFHLLLTGGFTVRTTLDLDLEQYVEQATQRHLNQPEVQKISGQTLTLSKQSNIHDAATVVMDAHTGEILAMDGSTDWTSRDPRIDGEVNGALALRQPASTFKPIIMAAAFELGWYPGIVLQDTRTYFPLATTKNQAVASYNTYEPTDYGDTYSWRSTTLDFAMANSFNIPAIKAYMFAGQQNVYRMIQRLGITTVGLKQVNPTIALGTAEVPLLQMVGAYQVFADGGVRMPPQEILRISDNSGRVLYAYDPTRHPGASVVSPEIAGLVTSLLTDEPARAYEFHNDHDLSMWDWRLPDGTHPDVAAKTGTTDNFKDNWTIGYTPNLVVGVWAGNANNASATTTSIGMTGAAPLWHSVIEYASGHCNQLDDQIPCPTYDLAFSARHFQLPPGLIRQSVNSFNGLAGSGYTSLMIKGEQPRQYG